MFKSQKKGWVFYLPKKKKKSEGRFLPMKGPEKLTSQCGALSGKKLTECRISQLLAKSKCTSIFRPTTYATDAFSECSCSWRPQWNGLSSVSESSRAQSGLQSLHVCLLLSDSAWRRWGIWAVNKRKTYWFVQWSRQIIDWNTCWCLVLICLMQLQLHTYQMARFSQDINQPENKSPSHIRLFNTKSPRIC